MCVCVCMQWPIVPEKVPEAGTAAAAAAVPALLDFHNLNCVSSAIFSHSFSPPKVSCDTHLYHHLYKSQFTVYSVCVLECAYDTTRVQKREQSDSGRERREIVWASSEKERK